jgi:predicted RNase H-like HicB family nuclease
MFAFGATAARPRFPFTAAGIFRPARSVRSSEISRRASERGGSMTKTYDVVIERDESGAWIARVCGVRGCHTYGRSLDEVRRRIREALSLWIDDTETAELREEIRLPGDARQAIQLSSAARSRAEQEREDAQRATIAAAELLVRHLGLGVRDAGELLGLSYQRVQQLVGSR